MRRLQFERSRYPSRVSASLVLALAVAALTVTATPRTAHACSCPHTPLPEYADEADLAIAGRQVYMVDHSWVPFRSGITLVLKVDRVYTGRARSVVEVRSRYPGHGDRGAECGGMGTTGVATDYDNHNMLRVNKRGSHFTIAELEEVFGAGYPPEERLTLPTARVLGSEPCWSQAPPWPSLCAWLCYAGQDRQRRTGVDQVEQRAGAA